MENDKVKYIKEKELEKKALSAFYKTSDFIQNPIAKKFFVFQKTKKDITIKDLL